MEEERLISRFVLKSSKALRAKKKATKKRNTRQRQLEDKYKTASPKKINAKEKETFKKKKIKLFKNYNTF